jgi:hypothetical protein
MESVDVESIVLLVWATALAVVVAGVFAGVLLSGGGTRGWHGRWMKRPAIRIARQRVWVIAGVLVAGVAAGAIGAAKSDGGLHQDHGQGAVGRIVDLLYRGVRQITGEAEPAPADRLMTRLSRVAGLAAILLLAFEVIVKLFQEPVQRWRLSRQRGHMVVCGLGRVGQELCRAGCQAGMRVTAIELDPNSPGIAAAVEAGALVWVGDATRTGDLRLVRAARAKHVFFVTGSDERNLEAAHDLLGVLLDPGGDGGVAATLLARQRTPPSIVVHLDRPSLECVLTHMAEPVPLERCANELKELIPAGDRLRSRRCAGVDRSRDWLTNHGIELRAFNVVDRAIQALFDSHILDRRPRISQGDGDSESAEFEVAHFVVVGFGEVGQRLALRLAETAHFENLRRSRMTIVHSEQERLAVRRFQNQYPQLFRAREGGGEPQQLGDALSGVGRSDDLWSCDVSVGNSATSGGDERGVSFVCNGWFVENRGGATSPSLVNELVGLAKLHEVRPMVFLCDADDDGNCAAALQLQEELTLQLGTGSPTEASCCGRRDHAITIFPFVPNRPMLTKLTSPTDSRSVDLIPFGDATAACTFETLKADAELPLAKAIMGDFYEEMRRRDPSVETPRWETLSEWERHTNLAAARHVNAKLRVMGLRLVPVEAAAGGSCSPECMPRLLDDGTREVLKQMEHNRWMAERLLRGWGFGEKSSRGGSENKMRRAFVPWEKLAEEERTKDDRQVALLMRVFGESSPERGRHIEYASELRKHFKLTAVGNRSIPRCSPDRESP